MMHMVEVENINDYYDELRADVIKDIKISQTSKSCGHDIYYDGLSGAWRYCDTHEFYDNDKPRPCIHCKKEVTEEGHDGCLGTLIGVKNACCGHGDIEACYVQFLDGNSVRGHDAKIILDILKKWSNK